MGNFFARREDLFASIVKDPQNSIVLLTQAVKSATNDEKDMMQDIKNFCVAISNHENYDAAFGEVNRFYEVLNSTIGVS